MIPAHGPSGLRHRLLALMTLFALGWGQHAMAQDQLFLVDRESTVNQVITNQFHIQPGDDIIIRINDTDQGTLNFFDGGLDADPTVFPTIPVTVRAIGPGGLIMDDEVLTITADVTNSIPGGIWHGKISSARRPDSVQAGELSFNGTLDARGAETVEIRAPSQFDFGIADGAVFVGVTQFFDEAGKVQIVENLSPDSQTIQTFLVGDTLFIELQDDDVNIDPLTQQTIVVNVTTTVSGDNELAVLLSEVASNNGVGPGFNSGRFVGSIPTRFGAAAANGIVDLLNNDVIFVTHSDTAFPQSLAGVQIARARTTSITLRTGITATLAATPAVLNPDRDIFITVTEGAADPFANINPGSTNDTVTVNVTSYTAGGVVVDTETIIVPEGATEAVFLRELETEFVTAAYHASSILNLRVNDNRLRVIEGGTVGVAYLDDLAATGETNVSRVVTLTTAFSATAPTVNFVTDPLGQTIVAPGVNDVHTPGDNLYIRVIDPNGGVLGTTDNVTQITIQTLLAGVPTGDTETIQLRELLPSSDPSRVYIGEIQTTFEPATATANNGTLEVRGRHTVRATYTPASGAPAVDTMVADIVINTFPILRLAEGATFSNAALALDPDGVIAGGLAISGGKPGAGELEVVRIGDTITVVLADDDLNTDSLTIQNIASGAVGLVLRSRNGDSESLFTLQETGFNTGVFTAQIRVGLSPGGINDGVLNVDPSIALQPTIVLEYTDASPADGVAAVLTVTSTNVAAGTNETAQVGPSPGALGTDLEPGENLSIVIQAAGAADGVANTNPGGGNDTVAVTVTSFSAAGGGGVAIDQETVLVPESALTEGRFELVIPTTFTLPAAALTGTANDGDLLVRQGGSIIAFYNDGLRANGQTDFSVPSAAINVVFAPGAPQLRIVSSLNGDVNFPVAAIEPGDNLIVRLDDLDAAVFGLTDTVTQVTVTTTAGDTETLSLNSISPDGGVQSGFTGRLSTQYGITGLFPNNGTLEIRGRDTITVAYTSPDGNPQVTATVVVNQTAVVRLLTDPNFSQAALGGAAGSAFASEEKVVTAGQGITIVIFDDDANTDSGIVNTIATLNVTTTSGGDVENGTALVLATETGPNTGIFVTNRIPTLFVPAGTGAVNTTIDINGTVPQFEIFATYSDTTTVVAGAVPGTTAVFTSADIAIGSTGTITTVPVPPGPLTPGVPLEIAVTENAADLSVNQHVGPGNDTITVSVTSFRPNGTALDRETLVLTERNDLVASFLGELTTTFNVSTAAITAVQNNEVLNIVDGGSVQITYNDELQATGATDVPVSLVQVVAVTTSPTLPSVMFTASLNGSVDQTIIEPGDSLYIRVVDSNAVALGFTDNVTATITTINGDSEVVLLTRVAPNDPTSFVYFGHIDSKFGDDPLVAANNGQVEVRGRDPLGTAHVTVTYAGFSGTLTDTVQVHVSGTIRIVDFRTGMGNDLERFTAGDPIWVQVEDDDLNVDNTAVETMVVSIRSYNQVALNDNPQQIVGVANLIDSELRNITLVETGANTGIFINQIGTALGDGVPTRFLDPALTPAINGDLIVSVNGFRAAGQLGGAIVADYGDLDTPAGFPGSTRFDSAVLNVGDNAVLVTGPVNAGLLTPSIDVTISITDNVTVTREFNAGLVNDTILVSITSYDAPVGGGGNRIDVESLILEESDLTSLDFPQLIPTEFVTGTFTQQSRNNDNRLQVNSGGRVEIAMYDPLDAAGQPFAFQQFTAIGGLVAAPLLSAFNTGFIPATQTTVRFVSSESESAADVGQLDIGDEVHILVQDPNLDLSPDRDSVDILLVSNYGDGEVLSLRETRPRSGIFAGTIQTNRGLDRRIDDPTALNAVRFNGTLEVRGGVIGGNPGIFATIQGPTAPVAATDTIAIHVPGEATFVNNNSGLGIKTTQIKASEQLFVQIVDDDANINTGIADTVQVTLTSFVGANAAASPVPFPTANAIDQEVITLTETGLNTGVFVFSPGTGSGIQTVFNTVGTAGNLILEVAATNADPFLNFVLVEYNDFALSDSTSTFDPSINWQTDTILIQKGVNATIGLVDRSTAGASNDNLNPPGAAVLIGGHDIRITITGETDASFHMGPANDTLTVSVVSFLPDGVTIIDTELVSLGETFSDGNFQGFVPTAYVDPLPGSSPIINNGVLEVVTGTGGGGQVNAFYVDPLRLNGQPMFEVTSTVTLTVPVAAAGVVTLTNSGNPSAPAINRIQPGDSLWIRVADRDINIVPNTHTNTITVNVTTGSALDVNPLDTDTEVVVLYGLGSNPEVFVGSVQTNLAETVISGVNTFRAKQNDGTLQVRGRQSIFVSYPDQNPSLEIQSAALPVEVNSDVRAQENLSIDAGELRVIQVGTRLAIRVRDDDLNTDPTVADTVLVTLSVNTGCTGATVVPGGSGDDEELVLTEVGTDSGIFTGDIMTRAKPNQAAPAPNGQLDGDGFLDFPDNPVARICAGGVTIFYQDLQIPFDVLNAVTPTANKRFALDAQFGPPLAPTTAMVEILVPKGGVYTRPNTLDKFIGGSPLFIRVTDPDADAGPTGDAISVTIRVTTSAVGASTNPANQIVPGTPEIIDQDTVAIAETGPSTGKFEVRVPTNFGPAALNDGMVSASGETNISVEYTDMLDSLGQMTRLFAAVTVAPNYLDQKVAVLVRREQINLDLPNGARLTIPENAIIKAAEVNFNLKYGPPISGGGDSRPIGEGGNPIPEPLDPQIQILRDRDKAFWYELQPTSISFKRPASLQIPIPLTAHVPGGMSPLSAQQMAAVRIIFFDGFEWISAGGQFFPAGSGGGPDPAQAYVQAGINHFTTFVLAIDNRTPPDPGGPLITDVEVTNNPFTPNGDGINDTTTFKFGLSERSLVDVRLFDSTGDRVRTLIEGVVYPAGFVSAAWDGTYKFGLRHVPAGIFVAQIRATGLISGREARETILVGIMK